MLSNLGASILLIGIVGWLVSVVLIVISFFNSINFMAWIWMNIFLCVIFAAGLFKDGGSL